MGKRVVPLNSRRKLTEAEEIAQLAVELHKAFVHDHERMMSLTSLPGGEISAQEYCAAGFTTIMNYMASYQHKLNQLIARLNKLEGN